jgi:hypothetical protein
MRRPVPFQSPVPYMPAAVDCRGSEFRTWPWRDPGGQIAVSSSPSEAVHRWVVSNESHRILLCPFPEHVRSFALWGKSASCSSAHVRARSGVGKLLGTR